MFLVGGQQIHTTLLWKSQERDEGREGNGMSQNECASDCCLTCCLKATVRWVAPVHQGWHFTKVVFVGVDSPEGDFVRSVQSISRLRSEWARETHVAQRPLCARPGSNADWMFLWSRSALCRRPRSQTCGPPSGKKLQWKQNILAVCVLFFTIKILIWDQEQLSLGCATKNSKLFWMGLPAKKNTIPPDLPLSMQLPNRCS